MNSTTHTRDERINLRLQHNVKRMLERAASFEGLTVSKFILDSALSYAEKAIQEHENMTLNAKDSEVFFNALEAHDEFNDKLTTALKEHDQHILSK